ncbi:hypothetical protein CC85DRAFT_282585 [Cutaneotrichosporon oleaginosum]|uniref:Small ribosomal subunit protein mS38 n=1 Tax=Cutaneotrichosporon oleaginosum TaxID=879819 RepID=A0A0J0XWR9_9TREE|nr:uncharacterized protein CC85DRAFT_282585 [Cutaneotrichosporon oleaginosum]KLT45501.1 hypothetical protein CC85DRAFT_282585 [Cutaneotrichosporon oleaginosum]TXT14544.1 hypothetical protein COLE_00737 [Cutaneotrichosporon oleaginosum]
MFRRLYSSIPERIAEAKPRAPTRGRAPRPVRLSKRIVAPSPRAEPATHGRRLRRGQLARTDLVSSQGPRFEPITLYPLQAGLHLGLTPAHMPLPLPLGIKGYTSPSSRSPEALFEKPAPPSALSALEAMEAPTSSTVGEHLRVSRAFAHPSLRHHLAAPGGPSLSALGLDEHVTSSLDAAATKHARAAEDVWQAALARLGERPPAPVEAAADPKLADALAGLNGLLARLESAEDIVVEMDSVKRKRKKKMNKHKYKKRRKATRAIRKRLGK